MERVPSIKGSVFIRVVEDIAKLTAVGTLSRNELKRGLPPEDLALLDQPVTASGWYDVQAYGRLLEFLKEVEGDGEDEYLRQRGARSAELLLEAGFYQQMEYLNRTQAAQQKDPQARFQAFGRDLRLLITVHGSLLNFGRSAVKADPVYPDRYVLEYEDVAPYPLALCWTTDGFVNRMAKQHGDPDLWGWMRPTPDNLLFRMKRPL
jgi:hypothetical protein